MVACDGEKMSIRFVFFVTCGFNFFFLKDI